MLTGCKDVIATFRLKYPSFCKKSRPRTKSRHLAADIPVRYAVLRHCHLLLSSGNLPGPGLREAMDRGTKWPERGGAKCRSPLFCKRKTLPLLKEPAIKKDF